MPALAGMRWFSSGRRMDMPGSKQGRRALEFSQQLDGDILAQPPLNPTMIRACQAVQSTSYSLGFCQGAHLQHICSIYLYGHHQSHPYLHLTPHLFLWLKWLHRKRLPHAKSAVYIVLPSWAPFASPCQVAQDFVGIEGAHRSVGTAIHQLRFGI